jgi:hypothetical protein
MFVGHLAVALGSKQAAPRVSLAALVAAAFGLDLLWPLFLLAGLEAVRIDPGNTQFTPLDFTSYPWSHSLVTSAGWALLAGLATRAITRSGRAGLVIGALVISHWVLDWITHRPDLPIWPGGPVAGLGLWNSIGATIAIEGLLLAAGVVLYTRAAPARDTVGRWAFVALIVVLAGIWLSGPFSPPPPSVTAIAVAGLIMAAVLPLWAAWIERHRATWRPPSRPARPW